MISTCGSRPSFFTRAAASQIARTCIAYRPGFTMPSRTPRRPSMGFASCSSFTFWSTRFCSATSSPRSSPSATSTASSTWFGRNSCSGGSSSRTVTGSPLIARKMPTKSSRWSGSRTSYAACSSASVSAKIICCTASDALRAQEHVLGAAEADALGAAVRARSSTGRACRRSPGRGAAGPGPPPPSTPRTPSRSSARAPRRRPTAPPGARIP